MRDESNIIRLISHGRAVSSYISGVELEIYMNPNSLHEAQPRTTKGLSGQLYCRDTFPIVRFLGTIHYGPKASCSPHSTAILNRVVFMRVTDTRIALRTVILAEADSTIPVEAVGPESGKLNIALAKVLVGDQEPGTKDTLGKNVEDGVGNDLTINTNLTSTVGKTPDTSCLLVEK